MRQRRAGTRQRVKCVAGRTAAVKVTNPHSRVGVPAGAGRQRRAKPPNGKGEERSESIRMGSGECVRAQRGACCVVVSLHAYAVQNGVVAPVPRVHNREPVKVCLRVAHNAYCAVEMLKMRPEGSAEGSGMVRAHNQRELVRWRCCCGGLPANGKTETVKQETGNKPPEGTAEWSTRWYQACA